jgi:hypothetical protein
LIITYFKLPPLKLEKSENLLTYMIYDDIFFLPFKMLGGKTIDYYRGLK